MSTKLTKGILELSKFPEIGDSKRSKTIIALSIITFKNNSVGVSSYGPNCNHPGTPCGSEYHRGSGHGYCQFCKYCN